MLKLVTTEFLGSIVRTRKPQGNGSMRKDIGIIITDQSDRVCRHRLLYHTKAIGTTTGPALTDSRFPLRVSETFRGSASGRPATIPKSLRGQFLGELVVQILGDIAPQNLVAGLAQMDLITPEERNDRLMVRTEQIRKDIDIIGIRLGPKKCIHQLIEPFDIVNVLESGRTRLDRNKRDWHIR